MYILTFELYNEYHLGNKYLFPKEKKISKSKIVISSYFLFIPLLKVSSIEYLHS